MTTPTDTRPAPIVRRPTPSTDGQVCSHCGNSLMVRTGSCLTCQVCGGTSGGCS